MTLTDAREQVRVLLDMAGNDSNVVEAALDRAERASRQLDGYTEDEAADYRMLRLALADVTGNPAYRL